VIHTLKPQGACPALGRPEQRGKAFVAVCFIESDLTSILPRVARLIEDEGINDASHLALSQSPVLTFGLAARGWKNLHLAVNKKRSSQRSMSCELNKHILPHLENTPLEEITYPLVRGLIQTWQREGLSRKSIKNLFGILRAIYNFQFDEMAQHGKPIVSPWLVKWKKVAPPKTVQRELPYFTVAQMAAIVNSAKTQLNRALFALAAGTGARAGELFALRVETDVNLNEQTITIRRSVFEGEENPSKSDTGDEDRTRTVPIDASVAMEVKKHLRGRRYGYPSLKPEAAHRCVYQMCWRTSFNPSCGAETDFSPCLFRGETPGHSRLVRTFFGQDGRPLHEDVAPTSRSRNGESEAVIGPKLDPIWTPTGREESGTLVHRVVN
jgi:integrase